MRRGAKEKLKTHFLKFGPASETFFTTFNSTISAMIAYPRKYQVIDLVTKGDRFFTRQLSFDIIRWQDRPLGKVRLWTPDYYHMQKGADCARHKGNSNNKNILPYQNLEKSEENEGDSNREEEEPTYSRSRSSRSSSIDSQPTTSNRKRPRSPGTPTLD